MEENVSGSKMEQNGSEKRVEDMTTQEIVDLGVELGVIENKTGGWKVFKTRNLTNQIEKTDELFKNQPQLRAGIIAGINRRLERANVDPSLEKEETITLTKADLEKMLSEKVDKATEKIRDSVEKMVNKMSGKEDKAVGIKDLTEAIRKMNPDYVGVGGRIYNETDIDPDDLLDTPVYYYTFMSYLPVWDKIKYGKPVSTPYGTPIRFEFVAAAIKRTGNKYDDATPIAQVKIISRKEKEWLEDDPRFGKIWHRKVEDAINVDKNKLQFYERARGMVATWGQKDITDRILTRNLKISDDMEVNRNRLVDAIVNEMIERTMQSQRKESTVMVVGELAELK